LKKFISILMVLALALGIQMAVPTVAKAQTGVILSGTVTDASSTPLPWATVYAEKIGTWELYQDTTDVAGEYAISLPAGTYRLYCESREKGVVGGTLDATTPPPGPVSIISPWYTGYYGNAYMSTRNISASTTLDIALPSGYEIYGDITDPNGNGVKDPWVEVYLTDDPTSYWYSPDDSWPFWGFDAWDWTDASGVLHSGYDGPAVPDGTYFRIHAGAPGYYDKWFPGPDEYKKIESVDWEVLIELDPVPSSAPSTAPSPAPAPKPETYGWTDTKYISNPSVIKDTSIGKKVKIILDSAAIASLGGAKVQFFVEGKIKKVDKKAPFTYNLKLKKGTHLITIKIFDKKGNLLAQMENTYTK